MLIEGQTALFASVHVSTHRMSSYDIYTGGVSVFPTNRNEHSLKCLGLPGSS